MYYGTNLRGTRSYRKQRCSELLQMVRQIGTPTLFFTLSAADYHWPDLFRILTAGLNIDPQNLTEPERRELMHKNPPITAWFFEQRCGVFMRKFLGKLLPVREFWYRYEWQFRGSPHIHGLLWLDNAPNCDNIDSMTDGQRQTIVEYFDLLCTAQINRIFVALHDGNPCRRRYTDLSQSQRELDLDKLLSAVQRHTRHGSYCMRMVRGSRRNVCRFGSPIPEEERSALRKEGGSWKFFPRRNDPLLQKYNRYIAQAWRGNTDLSPITSTEAVLNYIAKYASKAEHASEAYSDVLSSFLGRSDDETPAATIIRQLLISSVAERNYSGQEIMHLIMGSPLYHASRTFVILALREDWRRIGFIQTNSTVSRYSGRSRNLDHISLYEYAKRFYFRGGSEIERQKECIVRVLPYTKLGDDPEANEEHYRIQSALHIPWRNHIEDLRPEDTTWEEFYLTYMGAANDADPYDVEYPVNPDDIEFEERPGNQDHLVRNFDHAAARIGPTNQNANDPLGRRPIDELAVWQEVGNEGLGVSADLIRRFLGTVQRMPVESRSREGLIPFEAFSCSQRDVLEICRMQINQPNCSIKRVLVQGKAGTGKSAVIRAMCQMFDDQSRQQGQNLDDLGEDNQESERLKPYQVLAPTGAAAVNVDGKTIHSLLRIPVNSELAPLNGATLTAMQARFRDVKCIIIDEYSMIGLRLMHKIHSRLCETKGTVDEPFGGIFIYFFGDLRQLPPVMDIPIYGQATDAYSRFSLSLITSLQRIIILDVCHRQAEDRIQFRQTLDSVAMGKVTRSGWDLLMTRRSSLSGPDELRLFDSAVHLYPTNLLVKAHNDHQLGNNGQPVARILAVHNNTTASHGTELQAQGLQRELLPSIGCRVMLRKNLCVKRELVNGSLGNVKEIIFNSNEGPPQLPLTIMVEFDKYVGPFIKDRLFSVQPLTVNWKEGSTDCQRKQFPLILAYAVTIHKAQGLTLDKSVVDIGPRELGAGSTYVALSRVRRLNDLILANGFNFNRLSGLGRMRAIIQREEFLSNIESGLEEGGEERQQQRDDDIEMESQDDDDTELVSQDDEETELEDFAQ